MKTSTADRRQSTAARHARAHAWLACVLAVLSLLALPVRAQGPGAAGAAPSAPPPATPVTSDDEAQRTAIARALFEEGLQFVDTARWADAADRFARVLELRYSAVAAYNYGLSQARLGKLVLAAETLRKLTADPAVDAKVRDPALALAAEVEAKLGWLTIKVMGDAAGCELRVDGQRWPEAAWGIAAPVDPGAHTIVLLRGRRELQRENIDVPVGARVEQVLDTAPPKPAAVQVPTPAEVAAGAAQRPREAEARRTEAPASQDRASEGGGIFRSPWFWAAVGVVAAGAITTVAVVASSSGDAQAAPVKGNFTPAVIEGRVTP